MIISIYNKKGGSAKSTIAREFGLFLNRFNKNTLLIDMDYKKTITKSFDADSELNIISMFYGSSAIKVIKNLKYIDLICGSYDIVNETISDFNALESVKDIYDFVIIDNSDAKLNDEALKNSDLVIVPVCISEYDVYELEHTLSHISEFNKNIKILFSRVQEDYENLELMKRIEEITEKFSAKIFDTAIREDISVKEIQARKKEFRSFVPVSDAAEDLENFTKEFLNSLKEKKVTEDINEHEVEKNLGNVETDLDE